MNFADVKSITIPDGDVRSVAIGGVTVWQKPNPLPYDAEVDYVTIDGTGAYIDTGIAPGNNEVNWSIGFENGQASTAFGSAFGCRESSTAYVPSSYAIFLRATSPEGRIDICNEGSVKNMTFTVGTRYLLEWTAATMTLKKTAVSSGASGNAYAAEKASCAYPFVLGGINTAGTVATGAVLTIYSATFSRGGVLVRDFAPVRVGTAGALYDRVSGAVFASATSTPLTPGPDRNGGAA